MEVMIEGVFAGGERRRGFSRSAIGGVRGHMHRGSGGGGRVWGQKRGNSENREKAQRVSYLLGENFERLYRVAHCIGFKRQEKKAVQVLVLLLIYVFSRAAAASAGVCMCVCICSCACMSERRRVATRDGRGEGCKK